MPHKICFVLGDYFKYCKGGAELQAYYLAREFHKRGWEVHYIFVLDKSLAADFRTENDGGIMLHKIGKRSLISRLGKCLFLDYFEITKILKEIEPHLVYQRGGSALTGICASYSKRYNRRFVWATSSKRDCTRIRMANCANPIGILMSYIDNWLMVYGIKRADRIVTQAYYQTSLLKENYGVESIVVPNSHYITNNEILKADPPVVAWISSIKQLKRPELFIELARACQDKKAHFILAGRPGPDKYQDVLVSIMKKTPNVEYLGEISFHETNELLARASIFVSTSLPIEGYPNTFIQAWLQRTPVVSLNNDPDGVLEREAIGFHSKGFDQMVLDIQFLLENGPERRRMGEKARRFAQQEFDILKNMPKLEAICEELPD